MIVPDRVRLPLAFDVGALEAELASLPPDAWTPHFNQATYEGIWEGVALRSVGGVAGQIYPDPAAQAPFADTEILRGLPAFTDAVAQFGCPLTAARLLALDPGSVIKEHRDYRLSWEDGEVRIHVAIVTDEDVEFVLDGRRVELAAGEPWYLDLNRPHRVANRSRLRRVHLVVDCVVDDWLTSLMRRALTASAGAVG